MSKKRRTINIITLVLFLILLFMYVSVDIFSWNFLLPDFRLENIFPIITSVMIVGKAILLVIGFKVISLLILFTIIILQIFNYMYYRKDQNKES